MGGGHGKPRFWMWFAMLYFCNTQAGNIQGTVLVDWAFPNLFTSLPYDLVPMEDFLLVGDGMHGKPRLDVIRHVAVFYFCNTQAGNIQGSGKKFLGYFRHHFGSQVSLKSTNQPNTFTSGKWSQFKKKKLIWLLLVKLKGASVHDQLFC